MAEQATWSETPKAGFPHDEVNMCQQFNVPCIYHDNKLTLTSPIAIAADNKLCDIFVHYGVKEGLITHVNHQLADDSHVVSSLI